MNFQDNFKVVQGTPVVGKTYPLYGMITRILEEYADGLVIEINHNIQARLYIPEENNRERIRARAFEPAIFVSTVIGEHPHLMVECTTVVFGKSANTTPQ